MWNYEKRLQYPINIKTPNAKLAQFIMSQYGGPDGEIGASMRYLSQRFTLQELPAGYPSAWKAPISHKTQPHLRQELQLFLSSLS